MAATDRRIAVLGLLERVERQELEVEARRLTALRAEAQSRRERADGLLDDMRRDTVAVSIEAAPYVGGYITAVNGEVSRLREAEARLEEEALAIEEGVLARFRSMKTYATARDAARATRDAERTRREQALAEEQALQRWTRARR